MTQFTRPTALAFAGMLALNLLVTLQARAGDNAAILPGRTVVKPIGVTSTPLPICLGGQVSQWDPVCQKNRCVNPGTASGGCISGYTNVCANDRATCVPNAGVGKPVPSCPSGQIVVWDDLCAKNVCMPVNGGWAGCAQGKHMACVNGARECVADRVRPTPGAPH